MSVASFGLAWLISAGVACGGGGETTTATTADTSSTTSATQMTGTGTSASGGGGTGGDTIGLGGSGGGGMGGGSAFGPIKHVAAAQGFVCVVDASNTACCFGSNGAGELGNGEPSNMNGSNVLKGLEGNVDRVFVGTYNGCATTLDGKLWCWGPNDYGQVGVGTKGDFFTPLPVTQVTTFKTAVKEVSFAHEGSSLTARTDDGTVWVWGENEGFLGVGSSGPALLEPTLQGLTDAVSLGDYCAVTSDGTTWCWGSNKFDSIGDGTGMDAPFPVEVAFAEKSAVQVSGVYASCAVKSDGTTWCWGRNYDGEIGIGSPDNTVPIAKQVTALGNEVASVEVAAGFACAIKKDSSLWCWGDGSAGQLGNGQKTGSKVPVKVEALGTGVTEVSMGWASVCARKNDSSVYCWGTLYTSGAPTQYLTPTLLPDSFSCADEVKPPF
jgi:alpha-tubulin suppressor-like RCC1 family protein